MCVYVCMYSFVYMYLHVTYVPTYLYYEGKVIYCGAKLFIVGQGHLLWS